MNVRFIQMNFFSYSHYCVLVLLIESYKNLTMTFISYSSVGLTLIYRILRAIHNSPTCYVDSWYYDDGFSVQRSSIISTDFPKHLLSIAKNIVVCNKTRNSSGVVFSLSGRKWSRALHYFTWCRHDGDGQASFALQFYICTMKIYTGEKLMHTFIENKRQQKSCSTLYCFNP